MLRVYGWVPRRHCFVAVCAALEAETKKNRKLNDECRDKVVAFMKKHNVSEILYGVFPDAFPETP